MIRVTKLSMQNFLSHSDSEIDLLSYNGLTLIEGKTHDGRYSSNGSGKSTIIEGIYYALTGKTLRGLTADSVVNRKVGKDTRVSLEFESNHSLYKVERYRCHTQCGNDLRLYRDGEDLTRRIPTETQSVLDNIIELPNDILSSIMIMGEGMTSRFTQLSDPDKKKLLENTVRLSHSIDDAREESKLRLKKTEDDIKYKTGLVDSHSKVISDMESVRQLNIEEYRSKLEITRSEHDKTVQSAIDLSQRYNEVRDKIGVLDKAISDYNSILYSQESNNSYIAEIKRKLEDVLKDIPVCPTCHQPLKDPKEVHDHLNTELQMFVEKDNHFKTQIAALPDIEVLKSKKLSLLSELNDISERQNDASNSSRYLSTSVDELTRVVSQYEQAETICRELKEENKVLSEELTSLSKEKERLEYISKSIFSPTGVIVNILGSVVNYVDQRLQVYTNLLLDKVFHITFKRGKISLESTGNTYQSLSNGEKRRLDISIQFAIHDYIYTHCGIGFDTMFIDEILDTLDSVGVTNIIEVLNLKKSYCSMNRIFIVTHNDELKEYFDSILSVSKDADGITTIQ